MASQFTSTESRGKNRESSDQGDDHQRVWRPVQRRSTPRLRVADRIEAQGRIAEIPCARCYVRGTLCLVGSNAKRCAACARSGVRLNDCGVDRDNYREFPVDEDEEDKEEEDDEYSSNETSAGPEPEDTPMEGVSHTGQYPNPSMAGGESSATSALNLRHSSVLAEKIEWVNQKTIELLIPAGSDITDMKDQIFNLKKNVKQLYGRIRALEATVADLAGTRPQSG